MNYWILPDSHFGHHKMHDYCDRPEGFEKILLNNLRNMVKSDDVLIHLGDFCIYNDEAWHHHFMVDCLATKWLVKGNHDRKSNSWYLDRGWSFVGDEIKTTLFGKVILFSHKPVVDRTDFDINIHGHFHNTNHHPECETTAIHKCLFIEHDYKPFNLRKVIEWK